MKTIAMLFSLVISMAFSCNKNDSKISPNFSCKIDGKQWNPYARDWKVQEIKCEIREDFRTIHINARNTSSSESVSIIVFPESGRLKPGVKYPLNSNSYHTGVYTMQGNIQFLTDSRNVGEFEIIEIDTSANMIKGKFHFDCFNSELERSVKVTDGIFNIRYYAYSN